jgi:cobalamin-dependent methionine synthase I
MFIIANNITTRDIKIERIFREAKEAGWNPISRPATTLKKLTQQCVAAGADALEINLQQHYDRPEAMEFAINVIQQVADLQLCLSTNNIDTLMVGLRASCKRPPFINYISIDETRLREMLPLITRYGAGIVLLVSDSSAPADAQEMLNKTAILVGAANEIGIPNDYILVDPGLIHVTSDAGQRHLVDVVDFLRALPDVINPPVRSTCWLNNSSAGAPRRLRPSIETMLLSMLAGAGLSSTFLDILRRDNRRALQFIKIFTNKVVYSNSEIEV